MLKLLSLRFRTKRCSSGSGPSSVTSTKTSPLAVQTSVAPFKIVTLSSAARQADTTYRRPTRSNHHVERKR